MPRKSGKHFRSTRRKCSTRWTRSNLDSALVWSRSELKRLASITAGMHGSESAPEVLSLAPHHSRARKTRAKSGKRSKPERALAEALESAGVCPWVEEHKFHPTRRWKFDFAWPHLMIAAEVEGGVFIRGRHTTGKGFVADCEKYNEATALGWSVYRLPVATDWIPYAVEILTRALFIAQGPRVAIP
jgi:hypothetical protein